MFNNSYGVVLAIAVGAIVLGTLLWNAFSSKRQSLTFDKAERFVIFLVVAVALVYAVFSNLFNG